MRYLIGLGNYTASDDAVGVRVVEHVVAHQLEHGFQAIDLGARTLDLVAYLVPGTAAILIVDAADFGAAPGEYRFFAPEEVETRKVLAGQSTHEADLLRVLDLAGRAGEPIPPILIMGIQPQSLGGGTELSPALHARLAEYATAAVARLASMPPAG